jgi:hypothetical protein
MSKFSIGGFIKDVIASVIPFDNDSNGFAADEVQSAIEEARDTAAGFPRAGLTLVQNGTMSNNDLISYSHLTPNTPIIFPINTQLNEVTFSNNRLSVECDIEVWRGLAGSGTLLTTLNVSTAGGRTAVFDLNGNNITFVPNEQLQLRYKDQGTNARDMVITLWISRIP